MTGSTGTMRSSVERTTALGTCSWCFQYVGKPGGGEMYEMAGRWQRRCTRWVEMGRESEVRSTGRVCVGGKRRGEEASKSKDSSHGRDWAMGTHQ